MTGESASVLLELTCPAAGDRDLGELLDVILEVTAASWAELRLVPGGASSQRRFRRGTGAGPGVEVSLPRCSGFTASLALGVRRAPPEPVLRLIGLTFENMLLARRSLVQASLLRTALDTTESAVLLFDSGGAIVYANSIGDTLLSEQTERQLMVVPRTREPVPLISHVCRMFEGLAEAADSSRGSRETLTLSDGSIVVCELARVQVDDAAGGSGVLAVLQRIEERLSPTIEAIATAHDLSPRETDVTRLLLKGHPTASIADQLGISSHTVRDHLKHVYRKTGTRSRAELVCRLTASTEPPGHDMRG